VGSTSIAKEFGGLVRQLRTEIGLSQEEFAERCGLHRTYIGAIERGEKTVTIETALKLAKALNTSLSALFTKLEK
jgi:transcriptional regulator with XRE-family HTH domain